MGTALSIDGLETLAPAIHVAGLTVKAGRTNQRRALLTGVSFDIPPRSFIGVIGTSGCGKSTLIKTLAGLMPVTSGKVMFAGYPVSDLSEGLPLAVAYLPQVGSFHAELTVEENLRNAVALRLPAAVNGDVRETWVQHIIGLAGLESLLAQPYSTLSGGQMRRMALAEQLVGDPAFLLLDELTSGLDEYSDRELMLWLRDLAHDHGKTVVLITHATYHLELCDTVLFLHQGRQVQFAPYPDLLRSHEVTTVADLFELYQTQPVDFPDPSVIETTADEVEIPVQPLKSGRPPSALAQIPVLARRQFTLFVRDRAQLWLHLALIVTFPILVAVFAVSGLPQVRQLTLQLESNIVKTLAEQLLYLKESFRASALVSGLAMFQVILLTLIGANNGAREIAKERDVLAKELRAGLSPFAYVTVKSLQLGVLCFIQALWMAWFVKTICGFPGTLLSQFSILFATVAAMSATCLAISAAAPSPERASLLAIYLVGFQLPLSGAALALPEWISIICRPFIAAYWGWSGYLQTLAATRHYDVVKQATTTHIASYGSSVAVLTMHSLIALVCAWIFLGRRRVHA